MLRRFALPVFFALSLTLFDGVSVAHASTSLDSRCDTPLYHSIERARLSSIGIQEGSSASALAPIIEYARDHRNLLEESLDGRLSPRWISLELERELRKLGKHGCIDEITRRFLSAVAYEIDFSSYDDLSIRGKVLREWPSLSSYWRNREHYSRLLLERFPDPAERERIAGIDRKLRKLYDRKIPGLGKVSVTDYLLLTFNRLDINRIGAFATETIEKMRSPRGVALYFDASSPDLHEIELTPENIARLPIAASIELSPVDLANLAINSFDVSLKQWKLARFPSTPIQMADSLVASFLSGDIDCAALEVLLARSDFKEPKKRFFRDLGLVTWGVANVVLYQHPVTAPFVILGTLVFESIERNKSHAKQISRESSLIRR